MLFGLLVAAGLTVGCNDASNKTAAQYAAADSLVADSLRQGPQAVVYTPERSIAHSYRPVGPPPWVDTFQVVRVSVTRQELALLEAGKVVWRVPISSAEKGIGNQLGSLQTPLGRHRIVHKIGDGLPLGAVLRNAFFTGEVATIHTDTTNVAEDLVTTRLLWLEGLEPGTNRGGRVDSYYRFIYIHGTPEEGLIGRPASHGCIRLRNPDVVTLFDRVRLGTLVVIEP